MTDLSILGISKKYGARCGVHFSLHEKKKIHGVQFIIIDYYYALLTIPNGPQPSKTIANTDMKFDLFLVKK